MIYKIAVAFSLVASASALFYTEDVNAQQAMFADFKIKFGRQYSSVEEEKAKFNVFVETLKVIDERNAAELAIPGGEACHGITKFADMSQKEWEASLEANKLMESEEGMKIDIWDGSESPGEHLESGVIANWNCCVSAPNDRGICVNTYAMAAIEQIETDYMINYLNISYDYAPQYSPQQVTSCCQNCNGCQGGTVTGAWAYVHNCGGIEYDSDYPYQSGGTGNQEQCHQNSSKYQVTTSGYTVIVSTETNLKSYIVNRGPFVAYLDATTWNTYTTGILSACSTTPNYYAQVTALDTGAGYWSVRAAEGIDWGMGGYIRLKWNNNTCNITAQDISLYSNIVVL